MKWRRRAALPPPDTPDTPDTPDAPAPPDTPGHSRTLRTLRQKKILLTMTPQEEKLKQEILADAQRKAERLLARAQAEGDSARKRAAQTQNDRREKALEESRSEGEVKHRNIIQGIWMEKRRRWLVRREECLMNFFQELCTEAETLRDATRHEASLAALAREALAVLPCSGELRVLVSEADSAIMTPEWLAACLPEGVPAGSVSFTVETSPKMRGGVQIATADGRLRYDKSYAARLERLQDDFRRRLAQCDAPQGAEP